MKEKSVVLIDGYAPLLAKFRKPLLRAMVARGHRVSVFASGGSTEVHEALASIGVGFFDVPIRSTSLNPIRDLATLAALYRLFTAVRPDTVLTYGIKPIIYGSLAARLSRVPERFSMITGVGYAFGGRSAKARLARTVGRRLYRPCLSGSRRVFFQNPDDLALFERFRLLRSPDQAVLINGSGVDLDHFAPATLPAQPSFLLLSRLLRDKGIMEYVEAARLLKRRHPEVRFRLAGWFHDNPTMISRADVDSWVREGVIEYLGHLDDVRPALAESSVYVLPSYYREGQPRSVLEAMAMGRPVVTTDAPGCRETVKDGVNGFLVPVRDARALACAMGRFAEEPALIAPMGAASRRIAEEKYDVHKVNAAILEAMEL